MRKRLLKPLAWFLILLLVLAVGGYFFLRSRTALSIVRRIAVEQLEAALGARVQIGQVTGAPLSDVTAHNLRIAPDANAPHGALFWADRVAVQYRGNEVLRRKPFAETLQRAVVSDFSLFLHRNAQGEWNWQQLFKKKAPPQKLPFFADVVLQSGVIHLRDEMSKDARGRPLVQTLHVRRVVFDAHSRSLVRILADLAGQTLHSLKVNGTMQRDGRDAQFEVQVNQFRPASWLSFLRRPHLPQFQRGAVNGTVSLNSSDLFAKKLSIEFASDLNLRNAAVRSENLKHPVRRVNVRLTSSGKATFAERTRFDVKGQIVGSLPHARSLKVSGQWSMVDDQSQVNATMSFDRVALDYWTKEMILSLPLDVRDGQASGTVKLTTNADGATFAGQAVFSGVTASVENLRAPLKKLTWEVAFKGRARKKDGTSLRAVPDYELNGTARGRDGSVKELNVSGRFRAGEDRFDGKVVVNDADLVRFAPVALSPQQAKVSSGRLNATLTATWNAKRKRPLVLLGDVSVNNLTARIANVPRAFTHANARLALAEDTVIVRTASGQWGKSLVNVHGRVVHFDRPTLNLNITSPKLHVADLTALVPKSFDLPRLHTTGDGQLRGRLTGAAHNPSFVGMVALPPTRVGVKRGEAVVPPMTVAVSVRNLANPQFNVQGAFARVDVSRLKLTEGETPVEIPAPIEGRFVVSGTLKQWRMTADARLPSVRVGDARFTQVNTSVVYANDVLRVNRLLAAAGGGTVEGTGVVRFVRTQPVLHFDATLRDVNIGEQGLWIGEWGLKTAKASGSVSADGPWENIVWNSTLSVRDARGVFENFAWNFDTAQVTARGQIRTENGSASVPLIQAHVTGGSGQVRFGQDESRTVQVAAAQGDLTWRDGTLLAENVAVSTWGGAVASNFLRYDASAQAIVGTLRASRLDLQRLMATFDVKTEPAEVNGTAELSGTTERLVARVNVPELNLPNAPLSQTNTVVVYHDQRLDFNELKTNVAGGTFAGQGAVNFAELPPRMNLEGQVTNVQLSAWQNLWREQNLTMSGVASGKLRICGSAQDVKATADLTVTSFSGANISQSEDTTPVQWSFKRLALEVNGSMGQLVNEEKRRWALDIGHWTLTDGIVRAGAEPAREFPMRVATGAASYDDGIVNVKTVSVETLGGAVSGQALRYVVDTGKVSGTLNVRNLDAWELAQVMEWQDYHVHGGTLNATNVKVSGTLPNPTFEGAARLVDADVSHAVIDEARATFTASRDVVIIHTGQVRQIGATYDVTGRVEEIDWEKKDARLNLTVTGEDIKIADIAQRLEISLKAEGGATVKAAVGGTLKVPAAFANVRVTDGRLGDAPLNLSLDVRLEEHILSVREGYIRTGDGGFDIHRGTVDTRPNGKVDIAFSGKDIPLQWVFGAARMDRKVYGTFDILEGTLGGTLEKPTGAARLVVKNPILEGEQLGDMSGRLTLANRVVRIENFQAKRERATATINGTIDLDRNVDLTMVAKDVPVSWLKPFIPDSPQLEGTAQVTLTAHGATDSPDVSGAVDVEGLRIGTFRFNRLRIEPFTITRNAIIIQQGAFRLTHRAENGGEHFVTVSGSIPISWHPWSLDREAPLHLQAEFKEGDLGLLAAFHPAVRSASGFLHASLTVDGTLKEPRVTGRAVVKDGRIVFRASENALESVSGSVLLPKDEKRIVFQSLTGKFRPRDSERTVGDFFVDGSVPISYPNWGLDPKQPLQLQARIDEGDLGIIAFLHPKLSESSGALSANLKIGGTSDAPDVTGSLSVKDGKLNMPALGGMVENLQVEAAILSGERKITLQNASGRMRSTLNGRDRSPAERLTEGEFRLTGDIGLPPALDDPLSEYHYNLALHIHDMQIAPRDLSPLSRISGEILLVTNPADQREELTIHELSGYGLANQGTFRLSGSVKFNPLAWKNIAQYSHSLAPYPEMLTDLVSSDFNLDLDTTNLRVLHRIWGGGTFNAHLTVRSVPSDPRDLLLRLWGIRAPAPQMRPPVPRVQGSIVVSDGSLRLPTSLIALSASTELPEFPQLDVTMGIHGRVQVNNPILSAPFEQGQLRVYGTPRYVSLQQVEDFTAYSGRLRLPRADARIREARLRVQGYTDSFLGTFEPRVTVDVTADARVGGYHITLGYGPAPLQLGAITSTEDPLRLTSDPPLPRNQIYTLLMGISPEGVFGVPTGGRLGHAFSEQLFGIATAQATSYVSRALERATGFELFDIYVRESGALGFNIQKQFGRFAIGVRQDFGREGRPLFRLQYAPSKKWLIEWEQTEREQTLLKVGWRLEF